MSQPIGNNLNKPPRGLLTHFSIDANIFSTNSFPKIESSPFCWQFTVSGIVMLGELRNYIGIFFMEIDL